MTTQKKGKFGTLSDGTVGVDDQAFLSQIEENIRSKGNEQVDAQKEAEQRAIEMDRIRTASASIPVPGVKNATPAAGQASAPAPPKKANPLEADPRYREYFQRLKRQKGEHTGAEHDTPSHGSGAGGASNATVAAQKVGPGSIVRFDDSSIGVYKDAVSGRDYALFYFLQPDGQFVPQGVFLQCYQARAIGTLPEDFFAQLRDSGAWNRDLIVFHLSKFDHVKDLDALAEHKERKPTSTPPRNPAQTVQSATPAGGIPAQQPASGSANQSAHSPNSHAHTTAHPTPSKHPQSAPSTETAPPAPKESNDGLVKGRRFQIKFGGKQWEAIYWTEDGGSSIVAHDTHGSWALMRLDLTRFKDSLELMDIVDDSTKEEIATQAAAGA